MQEETRHGVTIDRCSNCRGTWFDVEEIQKYLNARGTRAGQPVPKDDELGGDHIGPPVVCTCCDERRLFLGTLRGITYQRCSWCGGIFLSATELDKIQTGETERTGKPPLPAGHAVETLGEGVDLLDIAFHVIKFLFN